MGGAYVKEWYIVSFSSYFASDTNDPMQNSDGILGMLFQN